MANKSDYDVIDREIAFVDYKSIDFKKSNNWHFSKGVNPRFGSKNGNFLTFFLGNIGKENVFYDILEQKKEVSRL